MILQDQVNTLEQGKRLVELGVNAPSLFWHMPDETCRYAVTTYKRLTYLEQGGIPAYTVAELGMMLPFGYSVVHVGWRVCDGVEDKIYTPYKSVQADREYVPVQNWTYYHEAHARAAMLIYLLENNRTSADQVNQSIK